MVMRGVNNMDQQNKSFPVTWDQFHRDSRALAWRLNSEGPFAAMVAITRGGLVPAAIVARELEIRLIETVCISSYHDYSEQGRLDILKRDRFRRWWRLPGADWCRRRSWPVKSISG